MLWMSSRINTSPSPSTTPPSVTGVDSARAGYHRSFEAAGLPDMDPIIRSQVREKLLQKRREPWSKEKGQELLQQLSDSQVVPVRVLVDVDLRRTLRLTRREKKARLFLPNEAKGSLQVFLDHVYQAFPVEGMPHNMVIKIRRGGDSTTAASPQPVDEEEAEGASAATATTTTNNVDDDNTYITLQSDDDLVRAFATAEKEGQLVQLYIKTDKTAAAAMVPEYLKGMPDPRDSPTMQIVSFYRFFAEPKDEVGLDLLAKKLRAVWEPFGALGRIYVASEGINAQMAVPATVFDHFAKACASLDELEKVFLNRDRQVPMATYMEDPAFDALHIRIRDQVVADGGLLEQRAFDWADCGKPMEPEEWHQTVDDPNVIVLDCRNEFESEVGRFATAEPLNTSYFRESWDVLKQRLADVPKDQPILTYCTGGIRCIKVGAYLKQELGFENVARLEGGIVSYARHLREKTAVEQAAQEEEAAAVGGVIPDSKFKGINYVFDNRLGERITEDVLSQCDQCGVASDVYVNCANPNCHVRFIQCGDCGGKYHSCCSRGCMQAVAELKEQPPKGGYPAPPKSVYPPGVEDAFLPLGHLPLQRPKKRVWLQPGPFQNARLNRGFDVAIDAFTAAEEGTLPESDLLQRVTKETEAAFPGGAHMLSGHCQGRLLAALTKAIGARHVLEIGTFTGYATLCFAEGLPVDGGGKVVTCEIDARASDIAQRYFGESGLSIELHREPAMDLLQRLAALPEGERPSFDLVFVDGDKKRYKEYYDFILKHKLLAGGGVMVVDNVLWKGLVPELGRRLGKQVVDGGADVPPEELLPLAEFEPLGFTKRQVQLASVLHNFNMYVRGDPRTEQAFLPIRDGLLVVRWKGFERTGAGGK